ncbi:TPA: hypothetical protein ACH3X1_012172 [Trebouxia sp. C0004]
MPKRPSARGSLFRPSAYEELESNSYLGRSRIRLSPDEVPICQCKPCCEGGDSCGDDCQNRHTNHECHPAYCPCGFQCQNQQIQRHQFVETSVQHVGSKDWGLVAAQNIPAGCFVIEYIGEVISAAQAAERSAVYNAMDQRHTYFMHLSRHEVIDAKHKGNRARFINHSCQPNCETQKWLIDGETSVCVFSIRDIAVEEELTYDYHLQWGGGKRVSGYLEADSSQLRDTMHGDAMLIDSCHTASHQAGVDFSLMVEPCLERYDSDQDAALGSAAAAGPSSARLSQTLLQQGATAFGRRSHPSFPSVAAKSPSMPADERHHSPDSSATLSGSGPCSDASDLTSSHPSNLPKHQHKRMKLGSAQPSRPDTLRHAAAQYAPDPNLMDLGSVEEAPAQQQGQQGLQLPELNAFGMTQAGADGQLHNCHVLFQPTLSPPAQPAQGLHVHPDRCQELPISTLAPAYVSCVLPGLTPSQQLVKDREEQELLQALRHQRPLYKAGYELDDNGSVQLPRGQYKHMVSMKVVFAQRWQHKARTAHLSMKQLLLDPAIQLEVEQASGVLPAEGRRPQGALQVAVQSEQPAVPHAKVPIRLANLKNAMRKAELSGPELSSSTSSGIHVAEAADNRHIAWQVGQLSNTPLLNNVWVEHYVDKFNTAFDSSYWAMLDHFSAGVQ